MTLTKQSAMHIIDAANSILLQEEDMRCMHIFLEKSSEKQVIRSYQGYICEIIRQCTRFKNH